MAEPFFTVFISEFEKHFFEDRLVDFPKYLAILLMYANKPVTFLQASVHTESGDEGEVLTVETVFVEADKKKLVRIWGVKDLNSGVTLKVTLDIVDPATKITEEEYTIIENDEEFFHEPIYPPLV